MKNEQMGVVLAGHGVPATDCPSEWVGQLMAMEWSGGHQGGQTSEVKARIQELDSKIRNWPRRPENDPYKEGLEKLAAVLRTCLPTALVEVGYNEFCRPSVPEAIQEVIRKGARQVLVVPSMLTPGGLHSEKDIPKAIEQARRDNPQVRIEYVWPFDLNAVADLLAAHVRRKVSEVS
jgi:sirohydrochlorin cobaltochelatase